MQMLIVKNPDGEMRVFDLYGEDVTIGRERGQDMQLSHASVSREHARVSWEHGGYGIADLGSHNGVYVNGNRVDGRLSLETGDVVQLGHFEMIYVDGELPDRFAKLKVSSLQRWYAVGANTPSDSTHQLSTHQMKRLLSARLLMESGVITGDNRETIELEDKVWSLGRGADIPLSGLLISKQEATISWNGQNHVVARCSRLRALKVNGIRIKTANLEHGDILTIGQNQLNYEVRE